MKKEMHEHKGHGCHGHGWRQRHFEQEDINGKLIISLRDVSHSMRAMFEGRGSQKHILIVLSETGTVTQRELTHRLGIQPGSASEVVMKLESAGLITRTESEEDRRTADIALTEEGRRQAEEAKRQRAGRHEEMFSVLAGEEKEQLLALLEKVNADWEKRFADRRGEPHHSHGGKGRGPHAESEGGRPSGEGGHGCNHDCANCPHPCPKGRARLEGSR